MWCHTNISVIIETREFWVKLEQGKCSFFTISQSLVFLSIQCVQQFLNLFPFTPQIPNPLFDLAGITCGHFLVPFWTFFGATLIGKAVIKMHIQASQTSDSFPACSTVSLGNEPWSLLARPEAMEINLVQGIYNKAAAGLLQTVASE